MSSHADKGLDIKAVKQLHGRITDCLNKHLLQDDTTRRAEVGSFDLRSSLEWEKAPTGTKIDLYYCIPQKDRYRSAAQELGERARTRASVPVFPLKSDQRTWISWYEKLQVVGSNKFHLMGVSLGLWTGERGEKMRPLLRVEWDRISEDDQESRALRAQPHWQLDVPVGVHEVPTLTAQVAFSTDYQELQELSSSEGLESLPEDGRFSEKPRMAYDLSPYHLGMKAEGSWGSQVKWCHQWKPEFQDVPDWLDSCLSYLVNQQRHFPHKQFRLNQG